MFQARNFWLAAIGASFLAYQVFGTKPSIAWIIGGTVFLYAAITE